MSEWQPIETAPRDGSEFLAYDSASGKCDVCHYRVGLFSELGVTAVQYDGEFGPSEEEFGYTRDAITHWMPLPNPPTKDTP